MKAFSASTLLGNWQEDRSKAPSLRGGLPDLGMLPTELWAGAMTPCMRTGHVGPRLRRVQREYSTTAASVFTEPGGFTVGHAKPRFGMVTPDTLNEAAYAYGQGMPASATARFTSAAVTVPSPSDATKFMKSTVTRDAMASATGVTAKAARHGAREEQNLRHSVMAPPAGGPASLALDRGKKIVGITGEVVRLNDDPKMSTAAQRAWIQRKDAGIAAYEQPPPPRPDPAYMSLPLGEDSSKGSATLSTVKLAGTGAPHGRYAAFAAAPRVVTSVTATALEQSKRPGRRIWADEDF